MSWSGQDPVRTRSYKVSGARSAPPGQTTVPVSGSTVTSVNPSGVRARSKTGSRILSRTSTWPLSPSAKRRRRTPWRITVASVMSGVRPIIGAGRSAGVSHQRGRDASSRAARPGAARPTRVRTAVGGEEGENDGWNRRPDELLGVSVGGRQPEEDEVARPERRENQAELAEAERV